jgi:hypothetical protein
VNQINSKFDSLLERNKHWISNNPSKFNQLKIEYKLKLISDSDWKSVEIPTPEELLISPIHIYWHSEGEHPIIMD